MTSHEYWDVEVSAGVVRTMTLDELDTAYQNGLVHEQTRVKENGSLAWSTLALVAGIEEASPPPVSGPHSLSPQMLAPAPTQHASFAQGALDLDDEISPAAFRSKKKPIAMVFAVAAVAVVSAGLGVGAAKMNASAPPAAAAAPPPAVTALPAAVETAETTTDKRALSGDTKRALLEADQKRAADAEKKRAKNTPASKGTPRSTKDGLLKTGNKFDPLNGAL